MNNLVRHFIRIAICWVPMMTAADVLNRGTFWASVLAGGICVIVLDIYGWLKYELMPDLDPVTREVLRKITVQTKIDVVGWEPGDVERVTDTEHFKSIFIHKPTGVTITVSHPPKNLPF